MDIILYLFVCLLKYIGFIAFLKGIASIIKEKAIHTYIHTYTSIQILDSQLKRTMEECKVACQK